MDLKILRAMSVCTSATNYGTLKKIGKKKLRMPPGKRWLHSVIGRHYDDRKQNASKVFRHYDDR